MSGHARAVPGGKGFTLIELLVVLAVLALLTSLIAPNYLERLALARETVLRHNLLNLRVAIDQFYRDKGRYPATLDELVIQRYLRAVPEDPILRRRDAWVVVPPATASGGATATGVFDVRSGAPGRSSDGSAYADW